MNASLLWLRDFLAREVSAREVQDILTARAATVESVVAVRDDLSDIVVGRVIEVARHPDAEHLWLTRVDAGGDALLEVVCGAPNVVAGGAYPFAPVGAMLPSGIRIERRKIRGQVSAGMLCSARELGLGTDHTGILEIETDASPGTPFLRAVEVGDARFEIDVLPNRPDLLSHEGIARELAAAAGTGLLEWRPPADGRQHPGAPKMVRAEREAVTGGVRVAIDDVDGCWRYAAVVIRGVRIGPSPQWLMQRLEGAGVRSINNVVDVTNFMLHGFGQPMHAFDLSRLGDQVIIRRAGEGEAMTTLDGVARTLSRAATVIAGAQRAEAIAGVIGGEGTEVSEATSDILLEVAVFNPKRVRATRRALGVSTDASYRFERHVDMARLPERAALAAELIVQVAGGEIAAGPVDLTPVPAETVTVALRPPRAALVLGEAVPKERIGQLLKAIGFTVKRAREGKLSVTVPSWRSDIADEIDLIEEVARLHGYDSFPSDVRPFRPTTVPDDPMVALVARLRHMLVGAGFLETRPMPFAPTAPDERLRVRNPLTENEACLRQSLLPTLAMRAEYNLTQMQRSIRLFEIGTVFAPGSDARPLERTLVGAVLMGHAAPPHFTTPEPRAFDSWDAKWLAQLVTRAAFPGSDVRLFVNGSEGPARAGPQAERPGSEAALARPLWTILVDGTHVGTVVLLNLDAPAWASSAYAFEADITGAVKRTTPAVAYGPLPTTPAVEIDIALLVPDAIPAAGVEQVIRRHAGSILERLVLFDEFRGGGIEAGTRSLAWRLTFRDPGRTLRDREVESRREKLINALQAELGVRPRS